MGQGSSGSLLSTVFVDYDNIYLSLKRKSEEAAKKFAKDSNFWLSAIESGALLTTTNGQPLPETQRRLVMSRCYGNPVPRRNNQDNSTDMNSFPFVRHNFLRSGFEVIDCPPLTAQLKNSADIRMVMDIRDLLTHQTYFDEFIILSGDADFTPLLHRLRAHARRTVVFANDYTAAPYTAICDGEVRESDLIRLLVEGKLPGQKDANQIEAQPNPALLAELRREIIAEVTNTARVAGQPIPLESLADRAVRNLGHEKTVGSAWGGSGSFRELLSTHLTGDIRLNSQPPYYVYDASREAAADTKPAQIAHQPAIQTSIPTEPVLQQLPALSAPTTPEPVAPGQQHTGMRAPEPSLQQGTPAMQQGTPASPFAQQSQSEPMSTATPQPAPSTPTFAPPPAPPQQPSFSAPTPTPAAETTNAGLNFSDAGPLAGLPAFALQQRPAPSFAPTNQPSPQENTRSTDIAPTATAAEQADTGPTEIQKSIARIHEACQAPPLSPPEYRVLFEAIAHEISGKGLSGVQTLENIARLMRETGVETRIDDIRFVIEVISENDPWFEQGTSANLFASRFRNFVVARCRTHGLALTSDEVDLIDAWFLAPVQSAPASAPAPQQQPESQAAPAQQYAPQPQPAPQHQQKTASTQTAPAQTAQVQTAPAHTAPAQTAQASADQVGGDRWWNREQAQTAMPQQPEQAEDTYNDRYADNRADMDAEDFPRIVRGRLRG